MTGMIITFCFLVLYTAVQPYCTPGLSKTQACALIAQFISLFSGMCLVVEFYVQKDLINAGETDDTNQLSEFFGSLIIGINLFMASWPMIMVFMSGQFAEVVEKISERFKAFQKQKKPIIKDDSISESENPDNSQSIQPTHPRGEQVNSCPPKTDSQLGGGVNSAEMIFASMEFATIGGNASRSYMIENETAGLTSDSNAATKESSDLSLPPTRQIHPTTSLNTTTPSS
jgi:hypothetical protein